MGLVAEKRLFFRWKVKDLVFVLTLILEIGYKINLFFLLHILTSDRF